MNMNLKKLLSGLLFIVSTLCANAQVEIRLTETKQVGQKALVKMELNNGYSQALKGARVSVFMMDEEGKVVGQKAQWIVGGDDATKTDSQNSALESGKKNEYAVAVNTLRGQTEDEEPFKARITFSRLILNDGTLLNPQKAVIASKAQ